MIKNNELKDIIIFGLFMVFVGVIAGSLSMCFALNNTLQDMNDRLVSSIERNKFLVKHVSTDTLLLYEQTGRDSFAEKNSNLHK